MIQCRAVGQHNLNEKPFLFALLYVLYVPTNTPEMKWLRVCVYMGAWITGISYSLQEAKYKPPCNADCCWLLRVAVRFVDIVLIQNHLYQ